ncbi:hypothetical protein FOZ60_009787 [Perkinsus olseni]|uniref:Uncharacterized protein n=1 Tax=Perkinsus olseni TaxID=32597 RepID=A0A7J6NHM9_PEROL|nr:hypothetical protein FOZ60_009787 [Perkinsus olseni]
MLHSSYQPGRVGLYWHPNELTPLGKESPGGQSTASDFTDSSSESTSDDIERVLDEQRRTLVQCLCNSLLEQTDPADFYRATKACQVLVDRTFEEVNNARRIGPNKITNRAMKRRGEN